MKIDSRVAVVTGASSGMGAALARLLAAEGVRVGLTSLPDDNLDRVAGSIRDRGGVTLAVAADVTDPVAVRASMEQFTRELGPIDLLVLNAGTALAMPVTSFSADDLDRLVRVNLLGPAYAIEAVLPQMLERGSGHLVGMSSLASLRGMPVVSGYCATKAALANLLEGLRVELSPWGIAVTTVRPGFVRTPLTAHVRASRLVVDVETAARTILRGIGHRRRNVNFPWHSALIMGLIRQLPDALYDQLAVATRRKRLIMRPESTKVPHVSREHEQPNGAMR